MLAIPMKDRGKDDPVTDKANWVWWSGSNEEFFSNGPFETRDEAVDALEEERGFVIHALPYALNFSARRLLDDQYFECEDYFSGEHGEADRVGKPEGIAEADAELQSLLDAWVAKWKGTFVAPEMFAASSPAEFIEAPHIAAGPLSEAEEADLAALSEKVEAGKCESDDLERYYKLTDRKDHFAQKSPQGQPA